MSAALGALLVVAVAVLRIYLGWAYVGDRLLSAAVEYEETGWYDGQIFVKPPEVLARDRLLGSYEVPIALHSECICPSSHFWVIVILKIAQQSYSVLDRAVEMVIC